MNISYTVEPFSNAIEEAYKRLFPDAADRKGIAQLRWRFHKTPNGPGYFATATADGVIVGMIAMIASRLHVAGEEPVVAYQAVDAIVDPAFRGKGLFTGMGHAAQDRTDIHHGRLIWGFPNDNAAPGWFGKMGWTNFGKVPFMFRPLRSGYFLRRIAGPLGVLDVPVPSKSGISLKPIAELDDKLEPLATAFAARQRCGQHRTAEWLKWRLQDRPDNTYQCFGHGGPSLDAFLATELTDKHGGKILYVMEAMSRPEADGALVDMIAGRLRMAARDKADVALAWCPPDSHNRAIFRKAGFLPLPERLRPITMHFGAKALEPTIPQALSDGSAWYLSYLDSDTV